MTSKTQFILKANKLNFSQLHQTVVIAFRHVLTWQPEFQCTIDTEGRWKNPFPLQRDLLSDFTLFIEMISNGQD